MSDAREVNARGMRAALRRLRRARTMLAVLTVLMLGVVFVGLSFPDGLVRNVALIVGASLAVLWALAAEATVRGMGVVERLRDTDGGAREYERLHAHDGDGDIR